MFVRTEECRGNITTHVSKYICQYCQFLTKRTQPKHNILLIVVTIIKTAISVIDNFISPTHSELKCIAWFHTRHKNWCVYSYHTCHIITSQYQITMKLRQTTFAIIATVFKWCIHCLYHTIHRAKHRVRKQIIPITDEWDKSITIVITIFQNMFKNMCKT